MNVIDRIFSLLKENKMTARELSLLTGISQGNITDWKNGRSKPSYGAIIKISDSLNVSADWLQHGTGDMCKNGDDIDADEIKLIAGFKKLCAIEKELVLERVQTILELKNKLENQTKRNEPFSAKPPVSIPASEPATENRKIKMRIYDERASAGLGNYLYGESTYEDELIDEDSVPTNADFGIRINGTSMEPGIPDGSIVWVEERLEIPNGQVGIFVLNSEAFCKRLKIDYDERELYLLSDNQKYEAIKISEDDFLRTIGRVIGEPFTF